MSKNNTFLVAIIIMVILIAAGGAYWYFSGTNQINRGGGNIACTMEAKLCPDGSYVGRTGPNCEFAACPGTTSSGSGINGTVMLGPTCPVERIPPDPNCADKPYQTRVAVFRASDPVHAVAFANSSASGTFSVSLPAGDYTLGAGESNLPRCDHPSVTVAPQTFAAATISCDTGIR